MMHPLENPAFPDLVELWAEQESAGPSVHAPICVNDNDAIELNELSDPLIELFARMDIAENRAW